MNTQSKPKSLSDYQAELNQQGQELAFAAEGCEKNDWELYFIEDMIQLAENGKDFTLRQVQKLQEIVEREGN